MAKSTRNKPAKPYPAFPLFPHATGRWAKKIRGKLHYFGKWDDPQAALDLYLEQRDDLHAGRVPRPKSDEFSVRDLCNRFLTVKKHKLEAGEITAHTFHDLRKATDAIVDAFGLNRPVDDLRPDDFAELRNRLADGRSPSTLSIAVRRIRGIFKFAFDEGLIDRPVRYGQSFSRPSAAVLRRHRASNGPGMFERDELVEILKAAGVPLKALVLLSLNGGLESIALGNMTLEAAREAVRTGWLELARPKTGIERRVPLWDETRQALQDAIDERPEPKDAAAKPLAFVTRSGKSYRRNCRTDEIGRAFAALLKELGLAKPGRNFYGLRRSFRTIADGSRDSVACNALMGHTDPTMAGLYRQRVDDERLQAVVDHVREWLFS